MWVLTYKNSNFQELLIIISSYCINTFSKASKRNKKKLKSRRLLNIACVKCDGIAKFSGSSQFSKYNMFRQ